MYEQHWQIESRPFENTSDHAYYYPSDAHQGARLKLRYVLENRRGAAVLTGAAGLGKTMLVECLAQQMADVCAPWVTLVFPQMPADQIVAYIADELCGEIAPAGTPTHQHVRRIQKALEKTVAEGKHAVVVIDEAHLLDQQALEAMRLLLNFECQTQAPMTLLFAGQPALLPTFDRTPELDERVNVKCLLRRFTVDESVAYVHHRLNEAGAQRAIFTEPALETVHRLSFGTPRQINRLCDLALLVGFAEELTEIGPDHVASVAEELVTISPE